MNIKGSEIKHITKEGTVDVQPDRTFRIAAPVMLDKETHTYSNGLPSVTQILQGARMIDTQWFTDEARDRGTAACIFGLDFITLERERTVTSLHEFFDFVRV